MAGRRPKPTALKVLSGNPGKRPLNDAEPTPERSLPEKPKGLGKAASREWDFMAPVLLNLGLLSNVDGKALAAYCDAYAQAEEARRIMVRYGLVTESPKLDKIGQPIYIERYDKERDENIKHYVMELKKNPAVDVYNTFSKLMKSYLVEFGLTPASRSKLKIDKPAQADPMETFMQSRGTSKLPESTNPQQPAYFDTGKPGMPDLPDTLTDFDVN